MSEWVRIIADLHNISDGDRAIKACEELDKAADESWLPHLRQLLESGRDFFIREAAAVPIARMEGLRALPQLLHAKKLGEDDGHDNDGLVDLIIDLVSDHTEEASAILFQMIQSPSERERSDAAWLWGFAAKSLTAEPLLKLSNDSNHRVRSSAIGSLTSFKGRYDVFTILVNALEDPDEEVRCSAASSLGYYGDKQALPQLRKLYNDSPESVRHIIEYAIEQLGKTR